MDEKSLRIGNLVSKKYLKHPPGTGEYWADNPMVVNDFKGISLYPKNYKPIPLTPERLEKFKAKVSKDKRSFEIDISDDGEKILIFNKGESIEDPMYFTFIVENSGKGFLILADKSLEYVHQLQNLYFAFTGEEL